MKESAILSTAASPAGPDADGRLLGLLGRLAGVAAAVLGQVRLFLLLALLSAVWLTYWLQQALGLEWIGLLIALGLLGLPALLLAYAYVVLQEVVELPAMMHEIGGALKEVASPLWDKPKGLTSEGEAKRGGLWQLLRAAGILLELSRLGALPEAARAALALANPFFIALLGSAYAAALLLALAAAITGMLHALF